MPCSDSLIPSTVVSNGYHDLRLKGIRLLHPLQFGYLCISIARYTYLCSGRTEMLPKQERHIQTWIRSWLHSTGGTREMR